MPSGQSHGGEADREKDNIWDRLHLLEERQHEIELLMTRELTQINAQLAQFLEVTKTFVTKERFFAVQLLAYGFAALLLTGVVGALLAKVMVK